MSLANLAGEVLDDKYLIERELGKGGMGSVYSATHLGTDRPVAVKVIAPQFMRNDEFVERFKREAKAAGRLHHPNVVNVTDFGFARIGSDRVAYLVMEFLDGCTLAEVLAEEPQLAITWVVDIIEQTCSAVDAAHRHGIIHRDLKPDNIWLEPNRRGGYRVKVLDFGLAKLGDPMSPESDPLQSGGTRPSLTSPLPASSGHSTRVSREARSTRVIEGSPHTHAGAEAGTQMKPTHSLAEAQTLVQRSADDTPVEAATQILPPSTEGSLAENASGDEEATRVLHRNTMEDLRAAETIPADGLTRVGSILGTPLYMSPEQCRSEALDARTDIYSLGVIAYQMLAGTPPFTGDMNEVMRQHIEVAPPPLKTKRKHIPKRLARVVMSALAKDATGRPGTAVGFASALRAQSEGTSALLRRAFALYSEHFPKFFRVSLLVMLPIITLSFLDIVSVILAKRGVFSEGTGKAISITIQIVNAFAGFIASSIIVGVTIRVVNQLFLAPLRPIELRLAFAALRKRIRALMFTQLMVAIGSVIGLCLFVVPGIIFYINSSLSGPVVMMENLKGRAALRRSKALVSRARRTVIGIIAMQYLIPIFFSSIFATLIVSSVALSGDAGLKAFAPKLTSFMTHILQVLMVPLISTFTALLYLKTRAAGGESLNEAFIQLQEEEQPSRKWEIRIRERMHTSGSGSR